MIIGIACEDEGHFFAVTRIVDDALLAAHDWLDGVLEVSRSWQGRVSEERWYKYNPGDANDVRPVDIGGRRFSIMGHIRGEPLKPEAGMWRRLLLLFAHCDPRPDVVVLARDLDGYPERRSGIEQVRRGIPWPFEVVVATPQPEIEAWLVSGFVPADATERRCLDALRRELSFDPTTESARLTSHPNDALRDAKRVLTTLCGADRERWERCLKDRELLRRRGQDNGLAAFIAEVEVGVVPGLSPR